MNCKIQKQVRDFPYGTVKIKDQYKSHAFDLELSYLYSLDPDKLMAGFLETSGLVPEKERYHGWEETEIQGHTLGHYMTAVAQAYGYTGNQELLERLTYIITALEKCQREDGFLFASQEEIFDRVENKRPAWVPWYTMHKILSGLISVYRYTGDETAKKVASDLGGWIYRRCISWTEETKKQVLAVEYGGMNDCLYDLYAITEDDRFIKAAHQFDEMTLFQKLYEGEDILNGLHANTTIPKVLGALKRYLLLGEFFYLEVAKNFWNMVTEHHSYITGGNSEWEHFGKPDILDSERTACNCETCNTYNMLKLSKELFELTKERKYADFYESTYLNAILSSQNPETGMTTYFQPMASGYFKVYSTPYDSFWCCTGSGMENFTKLHEGAVYRDENTMYIIRYEDSEIIWKEKGLKLEVVCEQKENLYRVKILVAEQEADAEGNKICLLIPKWNTKTPVIQEHGISTTVESNWISLDVGLEKGNSIEIAYSMELTAKSLPDNSHVLAFQYGPYVLSADLGMEQMDQIYTGVNVLVPQKEMIIPDYLVFDEKDCQEFRQYPERFLNKTPGKIEFTIENQGRTLTFTPHYLRYRERYGIYWFIYPEDSKELEILKEREERRYRLKKEQLDVLPVGNDQYELAHRICGEFTDAEMVDGHPSRYCKEEGWFSYELQGEIEGATVCMTLSGKDKGSVFTIFATGGFEQEVQVNGGQEEYFLQEIVLPSRCFGEDGKTVIKFQSKKGLCRIFDELYVKRHKK
nr:beta-L-arabinofuranosidase domain-containing protein [uncultured Blautia sp.]